MDTIRCNVLELDLEEAKLDVGLRSFILLIPIGGLSLFGVADVLTVTAEIDREWPVAGRALTNGKTVLR